MHPLCVVLGTDAECVDCCYKLDCLPVCNDMIKIHIILCYMSKTIPTSQERKKKKSTRYLNCTMNTHPLKSTRVFTKILPRKRKFKQTGQMM